MKTRTIATRLLPLALLATIAFTASSASAWSFPSFMPEKKQEEVSKYKKHEPTTMDKIGAGTKQFFTDVGDTVTLKKFRPKPQKKMPTNPWIKQSKEESKPSWLTSLFTTEPKKPDSPSEWLMPERP